MAKDRSDSGMATAVALCIAAGAGIIAGLLLAPREGRETRLQLRRKASAVHTKARESIRREKDIISDVVDSAKQAVREGKEVLKEPAAGTTSGELVPESRS